MCGRRSEGVVEGERSGRGCQTHANTHSDTHPTTHTQQHTEAPVLATPKLSDLTAPFLSVSPSLSRPPSTHPLTHPLHTHLVSVPATPRAHPLPQPSSPINRPRTRRPRPRKSLAERHSSPRALPLPTALLALPLVALPVSAEDKHKDGSRGAALQSLVGRAAGRLRLCGSFCGSCWSVVACRESSESLSLIDSPVWDRLCAWLSVSGANGRSARHSEGHSEPSRDCGH